MEKAEMAMGGFLQNGDNCGASDTLAGAMLRRSRNLRAAKQTQADRKRRMVSQPVL